MANVKRKDKKGRNLRLGGSQRKDGRYVYKYTDLYGKAHFVYAWKLVPTDRIPLGKRQDISLREKEKQIEADLFDHIVTNGGKLTVLELVEKYVSLKTGVRHNTVAGYKTVVNIG